LNPAEVLEALLLAKEYADDLRSYCDGWEWKYKRTWDDYAARLDAAIAKAKGGDA